MTGYEMIDKAIENLLYPFGKPKGAELKELLKDVEIGVTTTLMTDTTCIVASLPVSYFKAVGEIFNDSHRKIVGDWLTAAIQEKYGRDFSELRWIKTGEGGNKYHICPNCGRDEYVHTPNYCAGCGARLLPPEGEEE